MHKRETSLNHVKDQILVELLFYEGEARKFKDNVTVRDENVRELMADPGP